MGKEPLQTPPKEAMKEVGPLSQQLLRRRVKVSAGGVASRAIRLRSPGKDRRKGEGQGGRRYGHGCEDRGLREAWCGRLLSLLLLPPPLFPPSPPSLPLQVRSSLGTNILSAMAAFAGTAILLMDFGVTNWVCCLNVPSSGKT